MREVHYLKVRERDNNAFGRSDRREILCFQYPFLDSLGECGVEESKTGKSSKIRTESTQKVFGNLAVFSFVVSLEKYTWKPGCRGIEVQA